MRPVFKRTSARFAFFLATAQGFAAYEEAAASIQCGLGGIQTLEIGNDYVFSFGQGQLWLKIKMDGVNMSAGNTQYPEPGIIKLARASDGDKDLFQRQMLILTTAFIKGTSIRIISDKTTTPSCDGTADDYQIVTCEDPFCGTTPAR